MELIISNYLRLLFVIKNSEFMPLRFSFSASNEKMKRQFNLDIKKELDKSYNIGCNQNAYVLTNNSSELEVFRWGLIPHWANDKNVGLNLINAEAEGIAGKLSFRLPVRQKRCLIFADGYFEWRKNGRHTQPFRVQMENNDMMAFAGVWDIWFDENMVEHKTFSIITVGVEKEIKVIGQKRMPVIINNIEDQKKWLGDTSLKIILDLLKPLDDNLFEIYPVSKDIDFIENNYPELYKPIELTE